MPLLRYENLESNLSVRTKINACIDQVNVITDILANMTAASIGAEAAGTASSIMSAHILNGDPHSQYHNDLRGDARYYTKVESAAQLAALETSILTSVDADLSAFLTMFSSILVYPMDQDIDIELTAEQLAVSAVLLLPVVELSKKRTIILPIEDVRAIPFISFVEETIFYIKSLGNPYVEVPLVYSQISYIGVFLESCFCVNSTSLAATGYSEYNVTAEDYYSSRVHIREEYSSCFNLIISDTDQLLTGLFNLSYLQRNPYAANPFGSQILKNCTNGTVLTSHIDDPGTGYAVDDICRFFTPSTGKLIVKVDSVGGSGEVLTYSVINGGHSFGDGGTYNCTTSGVGEDCTIIVDTTTSGYNINIDEMDYLLEPGETIKVFWDLRRGKLSVDIQNAKMSKYDNTASGLLASTVQAAIDFLVDCPIVSSRLPANAIRQVFNFSATDRSTPIIVGACENSLKINADFTLQEVVLDLLTPQASGSVLTVDIKKNGTTIFSTLATFDNTQDTTITATIPAVLATTLFPKGSKVSVEVTQVGDGTAVGLDVSMVGFWTP